MRLATLIRQETGDEGTFGAILFNDGFALHTLELPWEDNATSISCIPCGTYTVELDDSARFGSSYHLRDVPGRTHILFHKGNWAGRKSKPELHSDVAGCILLGHDRRSIGGQRAVFESTKAVDDMQHHLKGDPFELLIMSRIPDECFETTRFSG